MGWDWPDLIHEILRASFFVFCSLAVLCGFLVKKAQSSRTAGAAAAAPVASLPNEAVARAPAIRSGSSTANRQRGSSSRISKPEAAELARLAQPPLGTKLLDLPDVLLGEVFRRVPGAASKHAFYRACWTVRASDAVNNHIRSLAIPSDTFFTDDFSTATEQLLESLLSWPKHATLRSLTLVEPSSRHFCREHRYRTGTVWGSDDELSDLDAQSNSSGSDGGSSQSSQSEQALSSFHGAEGGEGEGSSGDGTSQDLNGSEHGLSSFVETDDGLSDEDDEDMSTDLPEDSFETLMTLFKECSKRGKRPRELMSTVEALCMRNWELNSSKAFAVGCMISACFPVLKSLTVANFDSLAVSGEAQTHYSLLRVPQFSNLQSLSIVRSMLINNRCIDVIAQLGKLRHLQVHQVPFYDEWSEDMSESDVGSGVFSSLDVAPLCSLTALQSLDIDLLFERDYVEVSGVPEVVAACQDLRDLSLRALKLAPPQLSHSSTSWDGPSVVPTSQLESLTLSHVHVSDLKRFNFSPGHSSLKALHLGVLTLPVSSADAHAAVAVLGSVTSQVAALNLEEPVQSLHLQKGLNRPVVALSEEVQSPTVSSIASALRPLGTSLQKLCLKDFLMRREDACALASELPQINTLHLHSCHAQSGALQVLVGKEMASLQWLRLGPCSAHLVAPGQIRAACSVALLTQRPAPLRITCMGMPHMHFERCKRWVLKHARKASSRVELEVAEFSFGSHSWVRRVKAWGDGNS